jgi:hypothetical protein
VNEIASARRPDKGGGFGCALLDEEEVAGGEGLDARGVDSEVPMRVHAVVLGVERTATPANNPPYPMGAATCMAG